MKTLSKIKYSELNCSCKPISGQYRNFERGFFLFDTISNHFIFKNAFY